MSDGQWEMGCGGGFLVPHRAVIRSLVDGHATQVQLNWSRRGQGLWSFSRTEPRWGLGFRWGSSGASAAVGRQASVLGLAELHVAKGLGFRFGAGIGWTQHHWSDDTSEGRQHVVIGSPINAAIEVGFHRRPIPRPYGTWHNRLGFFLTFAHQSNASFTQPNLGTNVASFGLSALVLARNPAPPMPEVPLLGMPYLPPPLLGWTFQFGIGRRQSAPMDTRETILEWGADRRWGGGQRLGAVAGLSGYTRPQHLGFGVHAGFQLRFSKVYVDLVHGRYLRRWQPEEAGYNRVAIQVQIQDHLWTKLALHTHGFRAHHPAFGLVWCLKSETADPHP